MPKKLQFPPQVFVAIENAGTEDEYLSAERSADGLAEIEEEKRVGVYGLIKTVTVKGKTIIIEE